MGVINTGMVWATGPIGSYMTSITGPIGPVLPDRVTDITTLRVKIKRHSRMFPADFATGLQIEFARNRLMIIVPKEYFQNNPQVLLSQYCEWLDEHNMSSYMIEPDLINNGFLLAFEREADMMQFVFAFR
jgi:hypothetical protein